MRAIVFVGLLALAAAAEKVSFDNYRVYRVIPASAEHLNILKKLESANDEYSYWKGPSQVFRPVDLMVSPGQQANFTALMDAADMRYTTYIENVQSLIDREESENRASTGAFNWTRYHDLNEIYDWLHAVAEAYPDTVKVVDAGGSSEGRLIKGVKLNFGASKKPGVFIEGGIHAREWISPATVTYLVNALLTSRQPEVRELAEAYDWYIFPVFNPDGYVYTRTTNRFWRKTRVMRNFSSCHGVDANRNWGYKWMQGGASDNPCDETYAGPNAFSEIETELMAEYISSIGHKLFAYIAFHSYSQLLLFPYGNTPEHLDNYEEEKTMGLAAIDALSKRYGTSYTTGNIPEILYIATGCSMDWVKDTFRLPVTYTYELRDQGASGFLLPAEQIIPNGEEVVDSLVALFKTAATLGYPSKARP
ncbi:zinc carboxypeptidase-like [Phymastichus coffea]|uniref:zinc carboxypeptidase-like n=1 Tax=Phymastichus coffea TaxID=108790 RepID=UPI00273C884E|nr:zinc carboxypeptidase-like [Phymastichus coffea]